MKETVNQRPAGMAEAAREMLAALRLLCITGQIPNADYERWEAALAGPADEKTAGTRPWITGPCPDWCTDSHLSHFAADDRQHYSTAYAVSLTTMDAIRWKTGESESEWEMNSVAVSLEQGFREAEPQIWLGHGEERSEEIRLTLAEAEELAGHLAELIALARKGLHSEAAS